MSTREYAENLSTHEQHLTQQTQELTGTYLIKPEEIPVLPVEGEIEPGKEPKKYALFGIGADPITAGFNAAAAFFNFLSTTEGQRVVHAILDFDEAFIRKCHNLFDKIHNFVDKKG